MTRDACTIAAHMAFIHADSPEFESINSAAGIAGATADTGIVDAKHTYMLLSTRVYLNVRLRYLDTSPHALLTLNHPSHPHPQFLSSNITLHAQVHHLITCHPMPPHATPRAGAPRL
jgi:hypothetical protein